MPPKSHPAPIARTGYPKLADYIGTEPQLAIFKRFGSLNAENLLFMQLEIANLEQELREIVANDLRDEDETVRKSVNSWRLLQQAGKDSAQWRKRVEIREKLKEYNEALLRCVALQRIDIPHKLDLDHLQTWMWDMEDGGNFPFVDTPKDITHNDVSTKDIYSKDTKDLVPLGVLPGEKDDFTNLFTGRVLKWLNDKFLYKIRHSSEYDNKALLRVADTIVTVVASLFMVISTIVLYFISSTIARLGAVAGFIMLFAFVLKFFTNGSRIDIFAAAAAFASVQVVFIGTTSNQT